MRTRSRAYLGGGVWATWKPGTNSWNWFTVICTGSRLARCAANMASIHCRPQPFCTKRIFGFSGLSQLTGRIALISMPWRRSS